MAIFSTYQYFRIRELSPHVNSYSKNVLEFLPRPLYGLKKISTSSIGLYKDLEEIQDSSSSIGTISSSSIGLYMDLEEIRERKIKYNT